MNEPFKTVNYKDKLKTAIKELEQTHQELASALLELKSVLLRMELRIGPEEPEEWSQDPFAVSRAIEVPVPDDRCPETNVGFRCLREKGHTGPCDIPEEE